MLQAKILEIVVVIVMMTRKIPRRILRKRLMGLRPRLGCSSCGLDSLDCENQAIKA